MLNSGLANIYVKSLSFDDIAGKYSFENLDNANDVGVIEIENGSITLVNDYSVIEKKVSIYNSSEDYITLIGEDENTYEQDLLLYLYDSESDFYYQYTLKSLNDDEFD